MNLSERLTMLRQLKNVGQKVLAAYLKVSIGTISNYENGVHQPDLETLCRFAEYYGVTMDYLTGRNAHSTFALSTRECSISMELREKIFLETANLSQNNLRTLEWFTRLLEKYEISIEITDSNSTPYEQKKAPLKTHSKLGPTKPCQNSSVKQTSALNKKEV